PSVRLFALRKQELQALENTQQVTDALQGIPTQTLRRVGPPIVKRRPADIAEQPLRLFITQLPGLLQTQKRSNGRATQRLPLACFDLFHVQNLTSYPFMSNFEHKLH